MSKCLTGMISAVRPSPSLHQSIEMCIAICRSVLVTTLTLACISDNFGLYSTHTHMCTHA